MTADFQFNKPYFIAYEPSPPLKHHGLLILESYSCPNWLYKYPNWSFDMSYTHATRLSHLWNHHERVN